MGLRYLNQRNKQNVMILSMIHFEVKQMIDSFKLEGVWKRKATQMSNDATKLMAHVTAELDEQARKQVKRAISHFKVDIVQNQQFSKDFQRESEDWFADIIEAAMEARCHSCQKEGDEVQTCKIREAFVQGSVPVFDEYAPEGVCPYKVDV